MNVFKLTAAAALVAASLSASAMTAVSDDELSTVSGQDGVSIAANLDINIGSFQWINTAAGTGSSVNFNNININGLVAVTIDVLSNAYATTATSALITGYDTAGGVGATATAADIASFDTNFLKTSDVVQFAFPNLGVSHDLSPSITVQSVTLGSGTASFGGFAINHMDLQGTTVLLWAH